MSHVLDAQVFNAIVSQANEYFIAPDGLMTLNPGEFRESYSKYRTPILRTADCDNGALFRCQFEILKKCLYGGVTPVKRFVDLEAIYLFLLHDLELYRNPGRWDEPITHDCVCALAAAAKIFEHDHISNALYLLYGSFWKTLFKSGLKWEMKKRRLRIWVESGFLAYCAGKRGNPLLNWWFKMGLKRGMKENPLENTNHALLLWVKFMTLHLTTEKESDWQKLYANYEISVNKFTNGKKFAPIFEIYFRNPMHPNRRLAALL